MELNSSVAIESSVAGSFGSDREKGMLLVMMICLYNALITTEAGNPSSDKISSACFLTSGSTRASTFALLYLIILEDISLVRSF